MSKYIDATALTKSMLDYYYKNIYGELEQGINYLFAVEQVHNAPAADVAPVQHGEWQPPMIGKYGCVCSICKAQADNDFDYCPNCGAEMDGGDTHD